MSAYPPIRTPRQKRILSYATKIYESRVVEAPALHTVETVKIVCISDTHNTQPQLPPGDVILHAGDLTDKGTLSELQAQISWLDAQQHQFKVVVAGNHDLLLDEKHHSVHDVGSAGDEEDQGPEALVWGSVIYLRDTATVLTFSSGRKLKVYGSPRTPRAGQGAFHYESKEDVWSGAVPTDTDMLLTHGPPQYHLDRTFYGGHVGCRFLLRELYRVRPRLVVFGHIHPCYGQEMAAFDGVQERWEEAMRGRLGWWGLVVMVGLVLLQRIMLILWKILRLQSMPRTVRLVNAAAVGGELNVERREPILVTI